MRPIDPRPLISTPSYSCWAICIVRPVGKFSCLAASCCIVDVVNGSGGRRILSLVFTLSTENSELLSAWMTRSVSSRLFSSIFPFLSP